MLALLSVLAVVFVNLARSEAWASAAYRDAVQCRLLALSGLEYAAVRLRREAGLHTFSDPGAEWRYGGGPLETAARPSYDAGGAYGFRYSGALPGTYAPLGDLFTLKILDTNSQLHLNSPVPGLASMLDTLGVAILDDRRARGLDPTNPIAGRGARIVALRNAQGRFAGKEPLRSLLGDRDFSIAEEYLTASAWEDPHVLAPTGAVLPEGMPGFSLEPRAPINVNTAPKPVLVAVLTGLRGPVGGPLPYATAADLADALLAYRTSPLPTQGPFKRWNQFYSFLHALTLRPVSPLPEEWAWAVLVNADPNFHPARLNVEAVLHPPFDKTELRFRTTEFCFREMGAYEVTALARLLGPGGREKACAKATAVLQVFEFLYHTVQADFEARRTSVASENATTWPNPSRGAGGRPADWAGHVQLQTDVPRPPTGAPAPLFSAGMRTAITAEVATGSPLPATDQESGPDVSRGGDLMPDGLFFSDERAELTGYASVGNADPRQGSLSFWVKFDRRASALPVPLLLLTFPDTSETGVQHRIRAALGGGVLTVESTRLCYVADSYGTDADRNALPVPYLNEESTWMSVLPGHGQLHEWHKIEVSWVDGTSQTLFVDGLPGVPVSTTPASPLVGFSGWPPYRALLAVGGSDTAERGREVSGATLDDLTIYGVPLLPGAPGVPSSRFEDLPTSGPPTFDAGRFESGFDPLPTQARVLGVTWTEWVPETYNGVPLLNAPASLELALDTGAGLVTLPPSTDLVEDVLAGLGLSVAVKNQSVRYQVRFKHNPAFSPLNVTPIFDDIHIAVAPAEIKWLEFLWVLNE